jgi:hypothetical protein
MIVNLTGCDVIDCMGFYNGQESQAACVIKVNFI